MKGSNYELDDRQYLGDLLPEDIAPPPVVTTDFDIDELIISTNSELSAAEEQSLYYLAGYCIQSLKKQKQLCTVCTSSVQHTAKDSHKHSTLLQMKNFKSGALFEVNDEIYQLFKQWEVIVRTYEPQVMVAGIAKLLLHFQPVMICFSNLSVNLLPSGYILYAKVELQN